MNWKILFNPFEKYSEKTLLLFGITLTLLGSFIGYLTKVRFDGVFDMHPVESTTFLQVLVDNLLNTLTLVLLFFLLGKSINGKTRWVDILSVAIISRIPFYALPLFNIGGLLNKSTQKLLNGIDFQDLSQPPVVELPDLLVILVFAVISILCLIWFVALFWNGFRVATNAKGAKNVILFAVLLLLAEVLSKVLISTFNA
ncbi:MAG: YIP1 family protein [Flavobacteriaceae bacterium]